MNVGLPFLLGVLGALFGIYTLDSLGTRFYRWLRQGSAAFLLLMLVGVLAEAHGVGHQHQLVDWNKQLELNNANTTQNRSEDNEKQREGRNRIGRRLLPEGFFSFAFILYGFVFFGVLLLWRVGGGRW